MNKRILTTINDKIQCDFGNFHFEVASDLLEGFDLNNKPGEKHYNYNNNNLVKIISILEINPEIRNKSIDIFKNGKNDDGFLLTAKERVSNIFNGFINRNIINPIEVNKEINFYKLHRGCHRLHCSILFGYEYIPAIIVEE